VTVAAGAPARATGPSTGSLAGERASLRARRTSAGMGRRGRKVYSITEAGRVEFARLLEDPATLDDSRSFALRMSLARYLSQSVRIGMLEQRRLNLTARAAQMRRHAESQGLDGYARSVMEHHARSVELEAAWVDALLASERAATEPRSADVRGGEAPLAREAN
jgi:hypothetical protein